MCRFDKGLSANVTNIISTFISSWALQGGLRTPCWGNFIEKHTLKLSFPQRTFNFPLKTQPPKQNYTHTHTTRRTCALGALRL